MSGFIRKFMGRGQEFSPLRNEPLDSSAPAYRQAGAADSLGAREVKK